MTAAASGLQAIVFDFDGVIANSEPLHFRAFRDVLAEIGVTLTEEAYYARYLGFDDEGAFVAIREDVGAEMSAERIRELLARKAARLEAIERDASMLFPGAADAIRRAAAAVPIAIASGARGDEIRRVLEREGLIDQFRAIVSADDTAVSKPAPDPYLQAVAHLEAGIGRALPVSCCVALEDSLWGLRSARAAGLRTVGVAHTYAADALTEADLVIPSIECFDLDTLARLCSV